MKVQNIDDLEAEMRAVARGEQAASPDAALPGICTGHHENSQGFKSHAHVESRRAVTESSCASAKTKATSGPSAARSQDFLYGDDGMPK